MWVRFIVSLYSLFVLLWFLVNQFAQDSWWGFVVLDKFAFYFLMPAVPVLFISIFSKNAKTIALGFVPVLIVLFFYGSFFFPISFSSEPTSEPLFRVATYNIWNHNKELSQVASVINGTQADVIALQEITEEQREELISKLKSTYPHYHVSKPIYGGTTALFSRYPLSNVVELDIQIDRPSIVANIEWNGQLVTVVSAHLNPSFWAYWQQPWREVPGNFHQYIKDQNAQVIALQNETGRRGMVVATFIACDCNSQETASSNRLLRTQFKDAFRTVGWQFGTTGTSNLQFERNLKHIDYHWYKGNAKPVAIYRGTQSAGSDHEPVIADFLIRHAGTAEAEQVVGD